MVITLTDVGKKKGTADNTKLYFPVNPPKISYSTSAYFREYSIINQGNAKIPAGEEVITIGWESFFPGSKIKRLPFVNDSKIESGSKTVMKTPSEMHNQIESWRQKGTKLKLNITGTPFSFYVYIDKYNVNIQDAYGSIYYSIEFAKAITLSVETVKKKSKKGKTTGDSRTSKRKTQKKYTVRKGDSLWTISKKFYKTTKNWKKIYTANKSTIEKAAKKHKRKSSNNGKYLYAGTILIIP